MRKIDSIVVHCSATRPEWMASEGINAQLKEIDVWHRDRGFDMIGYSYLVSRNGEVVQGRPLEKTPAAQKGHNTGSIAICLIGGFGSDADDLATEHYTPVQLARAYSLIRELQEQFNVKNDNVIGHNRLSTKACPGFRVQKWLAGMSLSEATQKKPERTKAAQSKTVKASAATVVASAGTTVTALSGMNETAQYIILGFAGITILFGVYIMKERLKAWAEGWH
jgi:N-acetylmuramoyl-L-alanine amidase